MSRPRLELVTSAGTKAIDFSLYGQRLLTGILRYWHEEIDVGYTMVDQYRWSTDQGRVDFYMPTKQTPVLFTHQHLARYVPEDDGAKYSAVMVHDMGRWLDKNGELVGEQTDNQKELLERDMAGLRRAGKLFAVSNFTRKELKRHFGLSSTVVYNGIGRDAIHSGLAYRSAFSSTNIDRPLLVIGDFTKPRKNLSTIVDATILLKEHLLPKSLRVVGDLPEEAKNTLDAAEVKYQVGNGLTSQEMHSAYVGASALVFPSLYEGFGWPILEAMARSLPVITSYDGACREVAGDAAVLVDPLDAEEIASAVLKLHREPDEWRRIASAGRERVRSFDWQSTKEIREWIDTV